MRLAKSLLWIDCTGGLVAGALILALSHWLSALYNLPVAFLLVIGAANLAYGAFSWSLARRRVRPQTLLRLLIAANVTWGIAGVIAAFVLWDRASPFGVAHLFLEGTYVGALGLLERAHFNALLTAT